MSTNAGTSWRDYLRRITPSLSSDDLARQRILITGGSGFIGTNILEFYRSWGAAVENIDVREPRNKHHAPFWRNIDLCDAPALVDVIARFRPTAVFHMAARADLSGKSANDYPDNTRGVSNLVAALRALEVCPRLLVASSRMVCDLRYLPANDTDYAPSNAYGESKVQTEIITRTEAGNAVPWIIVRPTGIWGPWGEVPYRNFFNAVRRGIYLHPRGYNTRKSYGFVGNMVFQLDSLMFGIFNSAVGRTVYCADQPTNVLDWSRVIADTFQVRRPLQVPYRLLWLGAKAGDFLKILGARQPPLTSFRLDNLTTDMVFDRMMAASLTGEGPFSLAEATAINCSWLKEDFPRVPHGIE